MTESTKPPLLFLVGPPAVGKLTVGTAIAERTGLRLLHNHLTIDLVLRYFEFGTAPFWRLVNEFRQRILDEVAASELPGLIFTYCWAFNEPQEDVNVERYAAPFRSRGNRVLFAELQATQEERLRRNETPFRLAEKPFKRDLVKSRGHLLDIDTKYQLNSGGRFDGRADYLRFDNTDLSPEAAAERVIAHFHLPTVVERAP